MFHARRHLLPHLLRTLMVGLLMLGIVGKPVMSLLCEMHELTHLMAASEHVDTAAEQRSDADHARGAHQFVHAGDTTPAALPPMLMLSVPALAYSDAAPAPADDVAPRPRRAESPFRPPIA